MNELNDEQNKAKLTLERNVAALENGNYGLMFSSGLAACCAITKLLQPGDHILVGQELYGGAYHLIESVLSRYNVAISYVDTCDPDTIQKAIQKNTKLLWLESPSNVLLKIADLKVISALAKVNKIITVADNTASTPQIQKPLDWGIDIVLHSSVKHLAGSTDIIGAAIVTNNVDLYEKLQASRNILGDNLDSFDCFRILKGLTILPARIINQEKSANKIANFLNGHSAVETVYYPGLTNGRDYELASEQMTGFGNVITFQLKGDTDSVRKLLTAVRVFALQEKMADPVYKASHNSYCSTIVHAKLPDRLVGDNETPNLVRLFIGLEKADDLIADLTMAMKEIDKDIIEFLMPSRTVAQG